ncbi:MAG TPA: ABC transporter permease, partial [Clostridiales bacterium]|nr:ABC transporter permease [Clostridiales bacterium]
MHDLRKKYDIGALLRANAVTIMFVVLCIICLIFSGQTVPYVMYELFGRLSRNAFIVLALILPIIAGMGINFAITIGAMAAQISALWVIEWGISGLGGFLVAMLMTVPIAGFFGYLIGNLLNKMKGQEMIGGLILGYFANGLYQLLFLFIFGNLIPLNAPGLVIKGSTGVANTIDLSTDRGFKYALDGIWNVPFGTGLYVFCGLFVVCAVAKLLLKKSDKKKTLVTVGICAAACLVYQIPAVAALFAMVKVPMVT